MFLIAWNNDSNYEVLASNASFNESNFKLLLHRIGERKTNIKVAERIADLTEAWKVDQTFKLLF